MRNKERYLLGQARKMTLGIAEKLRINKYKSVDGCRSDGCTTKTNSFPLAEVTLFQESAGIGNKPDRYQVTGN